MKTSRQNVFAPLFRFFLLILKLRFSKCPLAPKHYGVNGDATIFPTIFGIKSLSSSKNKSGRILSRQQASPSDFFCLLCRIIIEGMEPSDLKPLSKKFKVKVNVKGFRPRVFCLRGILCCYVLQNYRTIMHARRL